MISIEVAINFWQTSFHRTPPACRLRQVRVRFKTPCYNALYFVSAYLLDMKYQTPKSEDEILPNKLGLTDPDKIAEEEYRGFLRAEIKFESELDKNGFLRMEFDLGNSQDCSTSFIRICRRTQTSEYVQRWIYFSNG
ncbi:hypothetical protein [Gracilimonas sp.]|uniref:hypothetical protein n=1 Tax=Gracilimonas sp. TaxID=1974203 RepID=UPI0025BB45D3|nr:hypothetical protein [Gracilimonas sp.]